jgi:MFS transporter, CP family, cyanate transporter
MRRRDPALLIVLGGVSAALHVGKLPPALPALQQALGVTLLQAGFLLSLVQLAGMTLGLAVGLAADGLGLKRTMVTGLAIASSASLLGGWVADATSLMALRAAEGLGFLLASMPAPALVARLVQPERMSRTLGLWGAYMPFGTAVALVSGPLVIAAVGWQGWWWLLAAISGTMALWLALALPPDAASPGAVSERHGWTDRLRLALSSRGPWLVALCFAVYAAQWLAVIGFLPSVYVQAGLAPSLAGAATALAAAANISGNVVSGRLLQRGAQPHHLLYAGFAAMALGSFLAFAPVWEGMDRTLAAALRYGALLMFSSLGGLIPGTLFSLAVRVAPGERTVSATIGWAQQWSAAGQMAGPPLVAWVVTRSGGWHWSWLVTGGCALAGLGLAALVGALLRRSPAT